MQRDSHGGIGEICAFWWYSLFSANLIKILIEIARESLENANSCAWRKQFFRKQNMPTDHYTRMSAHHIMDEYIPRFLEVDLGRDYTIYGAVNTNLWKSAEAGLRNRQH